MLWKAAQGGHLAVLQWLRASGCAWDVGTCHEAAEGGHLAVLQWARANGCQWDTRTCSNAAGGRHLAVLQWARANGCPWDRSECLSELDRTTWMEAVPGASETREWILAQPAEAE